MLLGNDLFSANSKLRDPIKMVYFDGSQSPVTDRASSSQSVSRQMLEIFRESADNQMLATPSKQAVEHVELATPCEQAVEPVEPATSGDRIVESGVTLVDSEMVTRSSDLIEIAVITRSQSKKESDLVNGNTGSVMPSDDKNRMLKVIDII